jgi:DNA-binding MarR family transcriptional regulator
MHRILFSIKRADQTSRALQRKLLEGFGITPARFDLLVAIASKRGCVMQRDIHAMLGVRRSTAHRMILALEELGFITRTFQHRRLIWVNLTKAGVTLTRRVRKHVIRTGMLWLTLCCALGGAQGMFELERFTTYLRMGFQDPATLAYPIYRESRYGHSLDRWAINVSGRRERLRHPAFGFIPCPGDPLNCTFDRTSLDLHPR